MKRQSLNLFIIAAGLLIFSTKATAWKIETHRLLSQRAAEHSLTNTTNYLQNIGLEGLDQPLRLGPKVQRIVDWIRDGAELEDAGNFLEQASGRARFTNHFHNSLKSWAQAGLDDSVLGTHQTGQSSLLWAQDTSAQKFFPEGDWSWQTIRHYYYFALTAPSVAQRQENFAKTFRGLGHQMHLIQDAAQPDHVRNDAHLLDALVERNPYGGLYFESWANKNKNINSLAAAPIFPAIDLNVSYDSPAPVPITQFIDTDQYQDTNPSTSLAQGIAEYTNANFFSDNTLFAAERYTTDHRHYFPYPKRTSTDLQAYLDGTKPPEVITAKDGKADTGIWISKIADGEMIQHFVKPLFFSWRIYQLVGEGPLFYWTLHRDEKAFEDYAQKLIPRAVGYSAALVDYFFRGALTLAKAETNAGFVLMNNAAEEMEGTFALYYDSIFTERLPLWSEVLTVGANGSGTNRSNTIDFPVPDDAQKPGEYVLVFSGRLGAEEGAVVGAVVRLVTTVAGTLVDGEGRQLAGVTVVAVAGEEPNLYKRAVTSDANGAFVFADFPADREDIHLEVWAECSPCHTAREGQHTMIPSTQLLPFFTRFYTHQPDHIWFDTRLFPVMHYRAKTEKHAPVLNGTVDFGAVLVEYVSVVYEPVTVPGTGGVALGIWGSFPGDIYLSPGNGTVIKESFQPLEFYKYPDSGLLQLSQCPSDGGATSMRTWTYGDLLADLQWVQMPMLSQGRIFPTFEDVDGQVIGAYALAFSYSVWGSYSATDSNGSVCECVAACAIGASINNAQVQKTGLQVMIKVYR